MKKTKHLSGQTDVWNQETEDSPNKCFPMYNTYFVSVFSIVRSDVRFAQMFVTSVESFLLGMLDVTIRVMSANHKQSFRN
ncbi:hypothetical protein HanIR_Chr15g0768111 [Helianthus annuus]|nr:hypothetical protein HanIR_Chr15g0768111 [Helianthus annuus]